MIASIKKRMDNDDLTGESSVASPTTPLWSPTGDGEPHILDEVLMTGWRRDSVTHQWKPNPPEHTKILKPNDSDAGVMDLYHRGGYCFPLKFNEVNYEIPVVVG